MCKRKGRDRKRERDEREKKGKERERNKILVSAHLKVASNLEKNDRHEV